MNLLKKSAGPFLRRFSIGAAYVALVECWRGLRDFPPKVSAGRPPEDGWYSSLYHLGY